MNNLSTRTLEVSLGERSYPILIGENLLATQCDPLLELVTGRQVAIVSNPTVYGLYGDGLRAQVAAQASTVIDIALPDGEAHKNWQSLNSVFDALLAARFDRQCVIIALGGGVIGDVAGLAAALYQRGVDCIQVPTSLLAQVDSSVGGKTAINHPAGKNMVGVFHQPRLVIADMSVLKTLPPRELSAGLAEMLKHGAIADVAYLESIEQGMAQLRACDPATMAAAVLRSCEIKSAVVAADEREGGVRAILNFGHTFGHAIESGLGYGQWLHGEAVAAGMIMAADLSHRSGLLEAEVGTRLAQANASADLPVAGPAWPVERYLDLMTVDKKAAQGVPRFVLLDGLGKARVSRVDESLVRETLSAYGTLTDTDRRV
ncbi:MAG: 3-dehydroquinate synthase [Burkholderiaceae bacterium]